MYNNKSDIWGLACILFELVTKERAFSSDWAAVEYAKSRKAFRISKDKLSVVLDATMDEFARLVRVILSSEFSKRPSAKELSANLLEISQNSRPLSEL